MTHTIYFSRFRFLIPTYRFLSLFLIKLQLLVKVKAFAIDDPVRARPKRARVNLFYDTLDQTMANKRNYPSKEP